MTTDESVPKTLTWVFRTVAGIAIALLLIWFVDGVFASIATEFWIVVSSLLIGFGITWKQVRAGIFSLIGFVLLVIALERVRFWPAFLHMGAIAIFALLAFGFIWGGVVFAWHTRAKQRGTPSPIQEVLMVLAIPGGIPRTLVDLAVAPPHKGASSPNNVLLLKSELRSVVVWVSKPWVFRTVGALVITPVLLAVVLNVPGLTYRADVWWVLLTLLVGFGFAWKQVLASLVSFVGLILLGVLLRQFGLFWIPLLYWMVLAICALGTYGFIYGVIVIDWYERAEQRRSLTGIHTALLGLATPGAVLRIAFDRFADAIGKELSGSARPPAAGVATVPPSGQQEIAVAPQVMRAAFAGSDLYLLTFLVEVVSALVRSFLLYVPTFIALLPLHVLVFMAIRDRYYGPIQGLFGPSDQYAYDNTRWVLEGAWLALRYNILAALLVGFWPILMSLWHVIFPIGRTGAGSTEREALGAREPTRAELTKILDALGHIHAMAGGRVAAPSAWLVLDEPTPDAYTLGSTVYLSRAAIEGEHLPGIMAHELGHIAHKDGDLILALRRFIIPLAYFIGVDRHPLPGGAVQKLGGGMHQQVLRGEDEKIYYRFHALQIKFWLAFWFGGMGLFLLGQHWAAFWRRRDFLADDYAVYLGQAEPLIEVLTMYRHVDVAQPFLLTNRPYTAERLDRLEG